MKAGHRLIRLELDVGDLVGGLIFSDNYALPILTRLRLRKDADSDIGKERRVMELSHMLRVRLSLDQQWLEVVDTTGPVRCRIGPGVFDDVIGPYVNHKVTLKVIRGRSTVEVLDIREGGGDA